MSTKKKRTKGRRVNVAVILGHIVCLAVAIYILKNAVDLHYCTPDSLVERTIAVDDVLCDYMSRPTRNWIVDSNGNTYFISYRYFDPADPCWQPEAEVTIQVDFETPVSSVFLDLHNTPSIVGACYEGSAIFDYEDVNRTRKSSKIVCYVVSCLLLFVWACIVCIELYFLWSDWKESPEYKRKQKRQKETLKPPHHAKK